VAQLDHVGHKPKAPTLPPLGRGGVFQGDKVRVGPPVSFLIGLRTKPCRSGRYICPYPRWQEQTSPLQLLMPECTKDDRRVVTSVPKRFPYR
jgi:hypothetical protein